MRDKIAEQHAQALIALRKLVTQYDIELIADLLAELMFGKMADN